MRIVSKVISHPVFYPLVFCTSVALLYGRVLFFDINYFGDVLWVKNFFLYLTRDSHWWEFFLKPDLISEYYYRPLLNLSFVVDARLGQGAFWSYHLTNLILHAACVYLVFLVLQEWGLSRMKALAGALIFLAHPVLVEAVVWIPGRTDSLLGVFCFAGFLFFLRWIRLNSSRDVIGYAVCLTAALLTKETGIVLAFMASVMSLWPMRPGITWGQRVKIPSVSVCILSVWLLVRACTLIDTSGGGSLNEKWILLIENVPSLWMYLGKAFFPLNVSVFPLLNIFHLLCGVLVLMILLAMFFLSRKKDPIRIFWASVWFISFLLPSLVIGDLKYEYRLYVSMLGALIIVLELFPFCFNPRILAVLTAMLIGVFAGLSWSYSEDYSNQERFWTSAVESAPDSSLAHRNLGLMYQEKGDAVTALKHYTKALALNPREKFVYNNMGLLYLAVGDLVRAEEYFKKEILNHPFNYLSYYNLAQIRAHQKRSDEAAHLLEAVNMFAPPDKDVDILLMRIYLSQGRVDQAKVVFHRLRLIEVDVPWDILEEAKKLKWI